MKGIAYILLILSMPQLFAQNVSNQRALDVAAEFLLTNNRVDLSCAELIPVSGSNNEIVYYCIELNPKGYIIVPADDKVIPIIAYSFLSNFDTTRSFSKILIQDIETRLEMSYLLTSIQKQAIMQQWAELSDGIIQQHKFQQWPAPGTTSTEGWVETQWTQSSPYNQYCPMDPVTSNRSYAGCPAIAMAQIVNYYKTTNNTRFDDGDDYHHNYAGRNYYIDDDFDSLDFLSFPLLNQWLDSIDLIFGNSQETSNQSAAALVFACGTACVQVYTSQGSGTFSVAQAYDAYLRFGFSQAVLIEDTTIVMYDMLIDNMMLGYPAHLAVVNDAWTVGHNVVVDGYNTDGYFHINFGWGGSSDGWWSIPDPSFPYSMSVLEGIVLNIIPPSASLDDEINVNTTLFFPNPARDAIYFDAQLMNQIKRFEIVSLSGELILSKDQFCENSISVSSLANSTYLINVYLMDGSRITRMFIKQ